MNLRRLAALLLLSSLVVFASAAGCPGSPACAVDDDCADREICGADGVCVGDGDGDGDEEVDGGVCADGACSSDGGPVRGDGDGDGDEEVDGGACADGACSSDGGPVRGDGDGDGDADGDDPDAGVDEGDAGSPVDGGGDGDGDEDAGSPLDGDAGTPADGGHVNVDGGAPGADAGICGVTGCGDDELCDPAHLGTDDDCDGDVDEGCPCEGGALAACFKGDPALRGSPGCVDGTMACDRITGWGPCEGGLHAIDGCAVAGECAAINGLPFLSVDLSEGSALFGADATSETWVVSCPGGVSPCPTPNNGVLTPIASGEYTVTYTKTLGGGAMESCEYPLFVGAPGLRVELTWVEGAATDSADLDLQLHRPSSTAPWGGSLGNADVCAWNNCTASDASFGTIVDWSPLVPTWLEDPVFEANTCYFAPKGAGEDWQDIGMGCYSPRLDADNITCDSSVTDPQSSSFCNPENINVDVPPKDEWFRVGVHYYSANGTSVDVEPRVRIFCDGQLMGDLGPAGFLAPVTFRAVDGGDAFWLVADVRFPSPPADQCVVPPACEVRKLTNGDAPVVQTEAFVESSFGPAYLP